MIYKGLTPKIPEENHRMSRLTFVITLLLSLTFFSTAHASSSERLYYAAKGGYLQAAKELIETKNASTAYANINGETAFFAAVESGNLEMAEYLLDNRANINQPNSNRTTPLHIASRAGNLNMVNFLLENGAAPDATDNDGVTPLHEVAAAGHFDIMQQLVIKGANTEARTVRGWLPMHHAARFGHIRIVSTLLYRGTPMYIRTNDGKSIFDLAKIAGHEDLLVFLAKYAKSKQ
ncbi:hypothetical protein DKW60_11130 [Leucothrix pacifica]|uniref:Uncharacterized protein n=2 Tax=Leucothrix pacifica TaxID=1247513 RepID=A0A317CEL2_9GAMM|nr:hypothetical protein DKW60_11130 [Leucothrix pacifica]